MTVLCIGRMAKKLIIGVHGEPSIIIDKNSKRFP